MARNKKVRKSVGIRGSARKTGSRILAKPKPNDHLDNTRRKRRSSQTFKKIHQQNLLRKEILKEQQKHGKENNKRLPMDMILYPPIPPPPAPKRQDLTKPSTSATSTRPSKSRTPKRNKPMRLLSDTPIVIDSEDEHIPEAKESAPLFYVDTSSGFNDREVPKYTSIIDEPDDDEKNPNVAESVLEEGEIKSEDETDVMNARLTNSEEINILDSDDEESVPKHSVPLPLKVGPNSGDESVIFCFEEVIDVDAQNDRFGACDYIPIGYDVDVGRRKGKKRSRKDKIKLNSSDEKTLENNVASSSKRMVIIDGNNVAFAHTCGQQFSVKGLKICIDYIKKMGHEVKAVVPQFRLKKDKSTDQKLLEELYKSGDVLLAPSKNLPGQWSSSYDDRLIISVAEKFDAVIISNDNFRDLLAESDSWKKIIETRVIGYTWVLDAFFLPDDPYGRHGPKLKDLLEPKQKDGSSPKQSTGGAS
ncbi:uncharacterized protein LOC129755972 isoform X2 [Uranotaenia lowii]|uniref:uncharacterized protein LOC129755972 isoform X2 n=1 Tax=Uranotaenia lowii TaxID=190385 RepID=UPI002479AE08|nr:uncharacterized protein LOC129755972 isoform X2 [Uranotaenia lowii]